MKEIEFIPKAEGKRMTIDEWAKENALEKPIEGELTPIEGELMPKSKELILTITATDWVNTIQPVKYTKETG